MAIDTLVVDDEPGVRHAIAGILASKGYECTEAGSVAEARELLSCFHYDLAIVDIVMPPDSGVSLARSIRAEHPDTAIVVVTGVTHPVMSTTVLDLGVYGYVIKPIIADQLLVTVDNALRRRRLERARLEHIRQLEQVASERAAELLRAQRRLQALERALGDAGERDAAPAASDPDLELLTASMVEETSGFTRQAGVDTAFIERSFADIRDLLDLYALALASMTRVEGGEALLDELEAARAGADLGTLLETLPTRAEQLHRAVDALSCMILTLRTFHERERALGLPVDVNDVVETTVTAARGLWRHVARLSPDLDPSRPAARGSRHLLARAVLGLIVHSRDAIAGDERRSPEALGVITARTRRQGDSVEVRVTHSGAPLPDEIAAGLSGAAPPAAAPRPLLEARAAVVEGLRGTFAVEIRSPHESSFVLTLGAAEHEPD
jgi:DNA-binding response OmpR family regulator